MELFMLVLVGVAFYQFAKRGFKLNGPSERDLLKRKKQNEKSAARAAALWAVADAAERKQELNPITGLPYGSKTGGADNYAAWAELDAQRRANEARNARADAAVRARQAQADAAARARQAQADAAARARSGR